MREGTAAAVSQVTDVVRPDPILGSNDLLPSQSPARFCGLAGGPDGGETWRVSAAFTLKFPQEIPVPVFHPDSLSGS